MNIQYERKPGLAPGLRYLFLLSIWTVLLVVACGGAPQPTPSAQPTITPTNTPIPSPTPLPTWTPVPTAVSEILFVDPDQTLGPISPYVYGTNYGPWITVPVDLITQAENAGIRFLRFPGGNWGDENDLTERQIDQFITLARSMGAEPQISVRLQSSTVEQAVELMRYTNVEKGYNVRYWSIGNEPTLYPSDPGFETYNATQFNQEWRAFAEAMKAFDPTILLMGPDPHQYTGEAHVDPVDSNGDHWLQTFLEANGDLVDVVAIHRYPFPQAKTEVVTVADLRDNSQEWDRIIPNLRDLIRQTTGRDLPVAVTEVNSHWSKALGSEATPDSFYNAIWWADSLGRMINQGVDIVAQFALQSPSTMGGWGLLERYDVRPTYYVYQLYQQFGQQRLYAASGVENVSIYAAQRDDGTLTLLVINLGDEDVVAPLEIAGELPGETAVLYLFDQTHTVENMGSVPIQPNMDLSLPAQSISSFIIGGR